MLIKIGNKWVDASTVTGLDWVCNTVRDKKSYALYIHNDGDSCFCGEYETEEGVIKAMDEAAEKINAAQGCKPAAGKTTMEHIGNNAYYCARCKSYMKVYKPYKFCPACGREIDRWE